VFQNRCRHDPARPASGAVAGDGGRPRRPPGPRRPHRRLPGGAVRPLLRRQARKRHIRPDAGGPTPRRQQPDQRRPLQVPLGQLLRHREHDRLLPHVEEQVSGEGLRAAPQIGVT
jgi:hypothetical protein